MLIGGNEPGKSTRFYLQEIDASAARPVTPEGTRDGWLSSDGKLVLARGPEGKYLIYPIAGGESGRRASSRPQRDGRHRSMERGPPLGTRLSSRRDSLPPGARRPCHRTRALFKELAPADRTGLLSVRELFLSDDLRSYAYTAYYQVSSLFVSEARQ